MSEIIKLSVHNNQTICFYKITQINVANSANYKSVNQKEKIEVIQKNIETIQDEISKTPNKKTIPIKIKDSTVKKYLANSTDYESFVANLKNL